ncbi:hypothetical protein J6590_028092 [Homalodisca vitripennis]|nr:hypothetical protein J6590_028092 [Homalodisca vitripennis]
MSDCPTPKYGDPRLLNPAYQLMQACRMIFLECKHLISMKKALQKRSLPNKPINHLHDIGIKDLDRFRLYRLYFSRASLWMFSRIDEEHI